MALVEDKVAFVTGAAGGIGRATAKALAREGAKVMIVDLDAHGLEETRSELEALGARVEQSVVDVTQADQVEAAIATTIHKLGGLHLAHNNAAIMGSVGPLDSYPLDMARKVFDVNVFGLLHCLQPQVRYMMANGGGSIVNTASVSGVHAVPNIAIYTATKHAVIGLTKSAAAEYSAKGIRVNSVCPGFVLTNMTKSQFTPEAEAAIAAQHPIGRFAQPEEIAEAVLWLLSDKASFSTGSQMFVDGGQTI